jgi:hypothetical protein
VRVHYRGFHARKCKVDFHVMFLDPREGPFVCKSSSTWSSKLSVIKWEAKGSVWIYLAQVNIKPTMEAVWCREPRRSLHTSAKNAQACSTTARLYQTTRGEQLCDCTVRSQTYPKVPVQENQQFPGPAARAWGSHGWAKPTAGGQACGGGGFPLGVDGTWEHTGTVHSFGKFLLPSSADVPEGRQEG